MSVSIQQVPRVLNDKISSCSCVEHARSVDGEEESLGGGRSPAAAASYGTAHESCHCTSTSTVLVLYLLPQVTVLFGWSLRYGTRTPTVHVCMLQYGSCYCTRTVLVHQLYISAEYDEYRLRTVRSRGLVRWYLLVRYRTLADAGFVDPLGLLAVLLVSPDGLCHHPSWSSDYRTVLESQETRERLKLTARDIRNDNLSAQTQQIQQFPGEAFTCLPLSLEHSQSLRRNSARESACDRARWSARSTARSRGKPRARPDSKRTPRLLLLSAAGRKRRRPGARHRSEQRLIAAALSQICLRMSAVPPHFGFPTDVKSINAALPPIAARPVLSWPSGGGYARGRHRPRSTHHRRERNLPDTPILQAEGLLQVGLIVPCVCDPLMNRSLSQWCAGCPMGSTGALSCPSPPATRSTARCGAAPAGDHSGILLSRPSSVQWLSSVLFPLIHRSAACAPIDNTPPPAPRRPMCCQSALPKPLQRHLARLP